MLTRSIASSLIIGLLALAAACDSAGSGAGTSDDGGAAPQDPVDSATLDLSQRTGVPVDEITMISSESRQWPNACLGLSRPDEVCAEVITPGFELVLEANGERYTYRTDRSTNVRLEDEGVFLDA